MKKVFIISFFLLSFSGCYHNSNNLDHLNLEHIKVNSHSSSGKYLSATYSIFKGDVFTANTILNSVGNNETLLELQFYSNLVSGNFKVANNISTSSILKNKNNFLYKIPKFAISFKNKNFEKSLKIAKKNKNFFGFNKIVSLLEYWLFLSKLNVKENLFIDNNYNFKLPLHKLLILQNFYDIKKLKKIADYNLNLKSLSNTDILFLAGYYFQINDMKTFEQLIRDRLSDEFDKDQIITNFSSSKNIFNTTPNFQMILSSYLHNISYAYDEKKELSSPYIKILLELSIFIHSKMDISNYSLAELYILEKSNTIALKKLNSISEDSFFSLSGNLKKLSIIKASKDIKAYEKLLYKQNKKWPNNNLILYKLANFYKSNKNYNKAIIVFKKLILKDIKNNHLLFLYSICLDKIGKWEEANQILLKIIESDIRDPYSRNYLSYNLALKNQNLDLALTLIKKAITLKPNNGFFLDTLGWVLYQRNDFNSAIFYLEKAVTLNPNNSEIIDHLGDCYLMLGRMNEAIFEWKKALQFEKSSILVNIIIEKINKYE